MNPKIWWKYSGRYYHTDFIKGVKNLIKWLPIIWKDRDWDSYYIFEVLKFKIKNTSEYIGNRDFHLRSKRDAEIMNTCVKLIDKVIDDYYQIEYMDYHKSEYHWDDIPNKPEYKQFRTETISDDLDRYYEKYPKLYKRVLEEETNDDRVWIAMRMGHHMHDKSKKLLFTLMEHNIERWWD